MPLTIEQLRVPVTRDEALQAMLDNLAALGFSVTSWQSGSVQRTLLTAVAEAWHQAALLTSALVDMGFNETSTGDALTVFSRSHYDNERVEKVATEGKMVMTGAAVGPPYAVGVGDLVVKDTASGLTFRNIDAPGPIPASGTQTFSMKAEAPGAASNIGTGLSTLQLVTVLAGVTVTNPAVAPTSTWITTLGVDEEADASLQDRNSLKWASLPLEQPVEGYEFIAIDADTDVKRVFVDDENPRGPGTVDVYLARASGTATGPRGTPGTDAATAYDEIAKRRAVSADVEVFFAPARKFRFTVAVHITTAANNAAKQLEVKTAAGAYVDSLAIGGELIPGASDGALVFSELVAAMTDVADVRRVKFSAMSYSDDNGAIWVPIATIGDDVPIGTPKVMTFDAADSTFTFTSI